MIHRTIAPFAALAVAVVIACNGFTHPPEGPGTEYPCGVWGVTCANGPTITCCPQKHICGSSAAFSRCAPGYCCYDGDDWPVSMVLDAGVRPEAGTPQQPPRR